MRPGPTARLTLLTAVRWFGVGLVLPVLVLMLSARGLSIERVGQVLAVYGATTMLSELPTGGLSDTWGRRPVVVVSAVVHGTGLILLALFAGLGWIMAAAVLLGFARALASGPVEAWFVEVMLAQQRQAAVQPGLARGQVAESVSLGLGSVIGGQIPRMADGLPASGTGLISMSVPFVVAAAVSGVFAVVAAVLIRPEPARAAGTAGGAVGLAVKESARRPPVRRLMVVAACLGVVLSGAELLAPRAFAGSVGETAGAALYGVLAAAGFGFAALGALVAARIPWRGAAAIAYGVAALAALGIAAPVVGLAAACYLLLYLAVGVQGPVMAGLLHRRALPRVRSTMLSVESLALQFGGVCAGVLVGATAARLGLSAGFWLVALASVVAAVVILRDRSVYPDHSL